MLSFGTSWGLLAALVVHVALFIWVFQRTRLPAAIACAVWKVITTAITLTEFPMTMYFQRRWMYSPEHIIAVYSWFSILATPALLAWLLISLVGRSKASTETHS